MKLKEQKINDKEFKWSTKHIKFTLQNKMKKHSITSTNIRLLMRNEVNN